MHRITLAGSFSLVVLPLWLAAPVLAQAQDRAGAMMAAYQAPQPTPPPAAGQPAPPPAGQPVPPPVPPPAGAAMPPPVIEGGGGGVVPPGVIPPGGGGAAGGGSVGVVGSLTIGAMAVTPPPPIGYYAPARSVDWNMGKFWYYPYYYYPHSYWPTESCPWPERPGEPYMRPPAYMAYPPFLEPHWRYEWYVPQKYYRGFHFWLDQF